MPLAHHAYAPRATGMPSPAAAIARRYRDADLRDRIAAATPHGLVAMLYSGGREALTAAATATTIGDAAARVAATTRALRILDALDAALDHGRGGTIARALADAYAQVRAVTVAASSERRADLFAGASEQLGGLARAWGAIVVPAAR
ncbi:flagellar protein FliS [Polymorphobacter sp. PAMC 29334]|uniref:flagellar protein FliS n=1 Tax=Polymorphobacter sp. PAMC 29334 TaxID=2862331 RepID=UPI001C67EFA8|nr:flagellar protein FliS [Polymorphobacter sp. PAMC 29334]QYE34478.1 flagellar protein FliS [Polymorphobacter sp. PAMC 29334]